MSATSQALYRAPLVRPQPSELTDPAALARWMAALPPGALMQLQQRLAGIAASMPGVWQLAVARAAAQTGRPPSFPLPGADLGDFDFSALAVSLAQVGSQVGTALFANEQQRSLAEQTTASSNASNSALAAAQKQASVAVTNALAAARSQATTTAAAVSSSSTGKRSTASTGSSPWLLYGSIGVIGLVGLIWFVRK